MTPSGDQCSVCWCLVPPFRPCERLPQAQSNMAGQGMCLLHSSKKAFDCKLVNSQERVGHHAMSPGLLTGRGFTSVLHGSR